MLSPKLRVVTLLLSDGVSEVIPVEQSLQKQLQSVLLGAVDVNGRNSQRMRNACRMRRASARPIVVFEQALG